VGTDDSRVGITRGVRTAIDSSTRISGVTAPVEARGRSARSGDVIRPAVGTSTCRAVTATSHNIERSARHTHVTRRQQSPRGWGCTRLHCRAGSSDWSTAAVSRYPANKTTTTSSHLHTRHTRHCGRGRGRGRSRGRSRGGRCTRRLQYLKDGPRRRAKPCERGFEETTFLSGSTPSPRRLPSLTSSSWAWRCSIASELAGS
jgi:hypothetical protein